MFSSLCVRYEKLTSLDSLLRSSLLKNFMGGLHMDGFVIILSGLSIFVSLLFLNNHFLYLSF
jgi:hypothetical protein